MTLNRDLEAQKTKTTKPSTIYEILEIRPRVRIRVSNPSVGINPVTGNPKAGCRLVPEHVLTSGYVVEEHWADYVPFEEDNPEQSFVKRHYRGGIVGRDFGKLIVADLYIIQKTTAAGRKFILLDFFKCPEGTKPAVRISYIRGAEAQRTWKRDDQGNIIPADTKICVGHWIHFEDVVTFTNVCSKCGQEVHTAREYDEKMRAKFGEFVGPCCRVE